MEENNFKISAVEYKDIRGKKILYVIINVEGNRNDEEVIINVGDKNFKALLQLKGVKHIKIDPNGALKD